MTTLINALQTKSHYTENGMVTNGSTLNECVDLFFTIGAMRGQSKDRLIASYSKAFATQPLTALRILFWVRDVRGGAGERKIFRDILTYMAENHTNALAKNIQYIPEYGRWDDLLVLFGTKLELQAKVLIATALNENHGLCAKWMPRKGKEAIVLERFLKLTPKQYRKMLVEKTHVVEQLMCSKQWSEITYEHIPSLAMARYAKAFGKRDTERFTAYKEGDAKINASAVYPYDVIKTLKSDPVLATKMWDSLPNYMENNKERVLPICDVSDSMTWTPCSKGLYPMDVCLSLGLYISERNIGPFKDAFITFSDRPELQYLKGNLNDRYIQLRRAPVGGSTNIEAVFNLILSQGVKNKVPESEMPTTVLIMSDMEFNSCTRNPSLTAFDMIKSQYASAGYSMPKVVFWNIQSRHDHNYPVQAHTSGTALVSGFSPSILTALLTGEDMDAESVMLNTVHSARYERIVL